MHNPITLIVKDRRGNTLDLFDIDPSAATPLTIDATAGAYYQFNDETTGFAPPTLRTASAGDALRVSFSDDTDLIITHYFSRGQGALIGLQAGSGMQRYPLNLAPEHSLAAEMMSDASSPAPLALIGGVGLIAGGAALTGHHDHHVAQTAPSPELPTPQPPTPQPPTPQPPTPQPPTPQPPAPNQPGSVSIRGAAKPGATLTAEVHDADGVPADVRYQWLANGQPIAGANGKTYTVTAADAGKAISVQAHYRDTARYEESPQSAPLAVADAANSANHAPTGAVTISGKIQAGATIHASNSLADADGMGDVHYQWLAGGETIGSGADYTLGSADIGKTISVRASYTDGLGHHESRDSLPTAAAGEAASAPPFTNTFDEKTFTWAGVDWFARDTDWAPGAPQKSGEWSRDNIQLRGDTLDMHLTNTSGESPVAAQISSSEAMGYGSYQLTVAADFSRFDAYTVFGFFTYEWAKPSIPGHRELDAIEISRWGGSALQGLFTYWPTDDAIKVRPSYAWPDDLNRATIRMDWAPERITWTVSDPASGKTLHQVSSTENIPAADKQQIHLNFWTYSYDAPGWHKAQPQHISVESFSYTPSGVTPKAPLQHELRQLLDPGEPLLKNDAEPSRPAVSEPPPQYSTHTSTVAPLHEDDTLRTLGLW